MDDKPSVLGPGHPIAVAWMKGRSRSYTVAGPFHAGQSALAVAFNDHCDAIVATVVVAHDRPAIIEPSVIEFLNSRTILGWAEGVGAYSRRSDRRGLMSAIGTKRTPKT